MLLPFTLDIPLLDKEFSQLNSSECKRFLEFWQEYGVFYDQVDAKIAKTLISNNKTFRGMFTRAWKSKKLRIRQLNNNMPVDLSKYNTLKKVKDAFPDLNEILTTRDIDSVFKFAVGESKYDADVDIEISSIKDVDQCELVQQVKALSQRNVKRGEGIEEIWNSRFSKLSDFANQVTIVDRFCATESAECPGLRFFLRKLCESKSKINKVCIYSAHGHSNKKEKKVFEPEDILNNVKSIIKYLVKQPFSDSGLGSIKELILYIVPNNAFGIDAPDRYFRFDEDVLEVGHGTKLFSPPPPKRVRNPSDEAENKSGWSNHFNRKQKQEFHDYIEMELRNLAGEANEHILYTAHED